MTKREKREIWISALSFAAGSVIGYIAVQGIKSVHWALLSEQGRENVRARNEVLI